MFWSSISGGFEIFFNMDMFLASLAAGVTSVACAALGVWGTVYFFDSWSRRNPNNEAASVPIVKWILLATVPYIVTNAIQIIFFTMMASALLKGSVLDWGIIAKMLDHPVVLFKFTCALSLFCMGLMVVPILGQLAAPLFPALIGILVTLSMLKESLHPKIMEKITLLPGIFEQIGFLAVAYLAILLVCGVVVMAITWWKGEQKKENDHLIAGVLCLLVPHFMNLPFFFWMAWLAQKNPQLLAFFKA